MRLKTNGCTRDRGQLWNDHRGLHTGTVDACSSMYLVKQTQNTPIEDTSLRNFSRNLTEGKMLLEISCRTSQTGQDGAVGDGPCCQA